jgi:hypothetical protein
METQISTANLLTIIGAIISVFVGTGAIAFFLKYGIRLALLEELFKAKNETVKGLSQTQDEMDRRLYAVEQAVVELKTVIPNQLDALSRAVSNIMGRGELEAHLASQDARITKLEEK